ncbi:hypothetical protein [uncultured Phenylobacterium sp.]|uniref:hypothetical protein n=1 Tax=uncultured Phenylobacterium sp. TaxID=349273 RepID=UPI0025CBC8D0|nr:hypothetical protein [uncultured Phenylobacterium sp.]
MLPDAGRLIISAFDTHLWPTPLLQVSDLSPDLAFLASPAEYRAMRQGAGPKDGAALRLFPLAGDQVHEHFWWRYVQALKLATAGSPGPREWLAPLRCRPKALPATFRLAGHPAVKAHLTIWLWPFGWSSQVEVRLGGPIAFAQVRQATAALSGGGGQPFEINGQPLSLVDLFAAMAKAVKADVPAAGSQSIDVLRVPRRLVIGFVAAQGQAYKGFEASPPPLQPPLIPDRWSDSQRAQIASVLAGKPLALADINAIDLGTSPFSVIRLGRGDYALAHPQHGALLMMRHPRDSNWNRGSQFCLVNNVRASLIAWAALSGLAAGTPATPDHKALMTAGKAAAGRLRGYYNNPVFQRLSNNLAA